MQESTNILIKSLLISTGRSGIMELLDHMEQCGFYNAPCSSKYHLSTPGGLAEHSYNVCEKALEIATALYGEENLSIEFLDSIAICSLLHDIGKAGQFGKPNYKPEIHHEEAITPENANDPNIATENVSIVYASNENLLFVPHEIRSIAIISKFIELTEEEQFAILYHNGLYTDLGNAVKGKETPLYMILHFADMWASRVVESEK